MEELYERSAFSSAALCGRREGEVEWPSAVGRERGVGWHVGPSLPSISPRLVEEKGRLTKTLALLSTSLYMMFFSLNWFTPALNPPTVV